MGISGADLLLLDLAQLEASRLDAIKETVPITHTYSLARDFPLEFAELRMSGSCSFRTEEAPLHLAYPGTYGHRVRAVSVAIRNTGLQTPIRGLLTNVGVSTVSAADGFVHGSVRPPDALPLSEFRLRDDMAVYSLPDEALMSFEGSGVDTLWGLELAAAANPQGLGGMVDLLVTLDLRASFSTDVYAADVAAMPTSADSLMLASARLMDPASLKALVAGPAGTVTLRFEMTTLTFPPKQTNRKVTNLFVVAAPGNRKLPISFSATLTAHQPTKKVAIQLIDGAAASNGPPITDPQSTVALSPLNVLAGQPVDQTFALTIDPKQNPGVDFGSLTDVVLGIDYSADLGP
jgi:hypothetical protein